LVEARLWDETFDSDNKGVLILLLTRFSLATKSTPTATWFALLLKQNECIQQQNFCVYAPNAHNQDWTNIDHLCRGDFDACKMEDGNLKRGMPQEGKTCWRVLFPY